MGYQSNCGRVSFYILHWIRTKKQLSQSDFTSLCFMRFVQLERMKRQCWNISKYIETDEYLYLNQVRKWIIKDSKNTAVGNESEKVFEK